MENLQDIVVFARVVEKGSFTAAGKDLRQSPSAVSKHICRLEDSLSLKLLNRTTHHVVLTEAGAIFYEHCARIIAELEEARADAAGLSKDVKGVLKVHSSPGVGQSVVAPATIDFANLHESIVVELTIGEITTGIMRRGIDLMICSRDFERDLMVNMGLVAEDLGAVPYVLCAAPSYFAQHGVPTSPHDLAEHNCLVHTTQKPVAAQWHFADGTESYGLRVGGTFHSNLEQAILLAAVRGVGIARLPEYTASSGLADGRLRAIFQGQVQSNRMIKAFYPRSKYVSTKVRAFIECIKKRYEPGSAGA